MANNSTRNNFDLKQDYEIRKTLNRDQMIEKLNEWAKGNYEADMKMVGYKGFESVSKAVGDFYTENRENIKVLDVGAGTGWAGMELQKLGFKRMDGVDPSKEMMKVAECRNIYDKYYIEYVDGNRLPIETGMYLYTQVCKYRDRYVPIGMYILLIVSNRLPIDEGSYDCSICAGGFSENLIPTNALFEMTRVVKPGGIVCFCIQDSNLVKVDELRGRFMPLIEQFLSEGVWQEVRRETITDLITGGDGAVMTFKVLISEPTIPQLPGLKK
ncbi:hypothetical protein SNE40_015789 [Patella caerulea]|uniref:Methyltransferase domain-containing protein n=1 Tax=Patella caerulea TaxID=87958 RepID=A0AAN8PFH7_PATCE